MSAGFVILAQNWEYNDEYYSRGDGHDLVAPILYRKKEDAKCEVQRLNDAFYAKHDPADYDMDGDEGAAEMEDRTEAWKAVLGDTEPFKYVSLEAK